MATVRYFAAARAAAGIAEETVPGDSLQACLRAAETRHGPDLERVLAACSFLVDGLATAGRDVPLSDTATVDVLPPFAGG